MSERMEFAIQYEGERLRLVGKGNWGRNPLDGLHAFGRLARAVDKGTRETVRRCREDGHSWTAIGAALDMTKQSAWERFASEK